MSINPVLLTALLLAPWAALSAAGVPAEKPNVLLILADDLGYGDVSCCNDQARVPMPNLDRLAREGMRFTDAQRPCTTSTQLTSLTDVMATVAAIIGADPSKDAAEDSFNLLPALLSQDRSPIRPYLLQQAFSGWRTLSIWRGPWKYLDHPGSGGNRYDNNPELKPFILPDTAPGAPGQFYNLEIDPGETRNLYFDELLMVKELKALLDQSKSSGRSRPDPSRQDPSK